VVREEEEDKSHHKRIIKIKCGENVSFVVSGIERRGRKPEAT
jgi:hypothetical protein